MKTYTHPDGRTATLQPIAGSPFYRASYSDAKDITGAGETLELALQAEGFLDDQAEDAARFRFLAAAMITGSPEGKAGQAASEALGENGHELGSAEDVTMFIRVIDLARKSVKEQA